MDFLPLFLRIRDRECVVIGGGEVAARKVALLRRAGGHVRVVSPALGPTLAGLAAPEQSPSDKLAHRLASRLRPV